MVDETETAGGEESDDEPVTSGHVERTVLNEMLADDGRYVPTRVSDVLDPLAAVIERGDYGNLGMRNEAPTVRQSSVRRTFTQLAEKGFVERIEDVDPSVLSADRYALGGLDAGGDPADPTAYANVSDDARVTDWVLTDAGRGELRRLDERYETELDELAARFGRRRGQTTDRIDA